MFLDRTKINFIQKWWLSIDRTMLGLIFILMLFGNIFVILASPVVANRIGIATNTFLVKNIIFSVVGFGIIIFLSTLNKKQIKILVPTCFVFLELLLIIVLIFGTKNKGATRWIYIAGFSLQPSEIIKPFFAVLTSYIFIYFKKENNFNIFFAGLIYSFLALLLVLQPDIGMLILISVIFATQLFLVVKNLKYFFWLGGIAITSLISFYFLFEHFHNRINTFLGGLFLNGEKSYQTQKSLSAFANGGILGKGPFEGSIKNYIPDAHTDFIFSVVGEEFGAIICFLIVFLYFYIAIHFILKVIDDSENKYKYLSTISLSFLFLFQALINMGVTLNLLPTKGMTLPLISYGGSSMIGASITIGLLLAFTKKSYHVLSDRKILEEDI